MDPSLLGMEIRDSSEAFAGLQNTAHRTPLALYADRCAAAVHSKTRSQIRSRTVSRGFPGWETGLSLRLWSHGFCFPAPWLLAALRAEKQDEDAPQMRVEEVMEEASWKSAANQRQNRGSTSGHNDQSSNLSAGEVSDLSHQGSNADSLFIRRRCLVEEDSDDAHGMGMAMGMVREGGGGEDLVRTISPETSRTMIHGPAPLTSSATLLLITAPLSPSRQAPSLSSMPV